MTRRKTEPEPADVLPMNGESATATMEAPAESDQVDAKGWRDLPISDLELEPALAERIKKHGCKNIGELADVLQSPFPPDLELLKEIGPDETRRLLGLVKDAAGETMEPGEDDDEEDEEPDDGASEEAFAASRSRLAAQQTYPDDMSPEVKAEIRKHLELIKKCKDDLEDAKDDVKVKRGYWEGAVAKMETLLKELTEEMPLFENKNGKHETEPVATTADTPAAPVEDESWKEVRLDTLGIPPGVISKLHEADIDTMGQLVAWQSDGRELTMIKGIGPGARTKIEEATTRFWELRSKAAPETNGAAGEAKPAECETTAVETVEAAPASETKEAT